MQMGDHQMMGNQRYYRTYVQKVMPAQAGGAVSQNATYVQTAGIRTVHHDGNGQQRIVQLPPGVRQIQQNGVGPAYVRQVPGGQPMQVNFGHPGTIAGRNVAVGVQMRPVQGHNVQQGYQRQQVANQIQQQNRAVFMAQNQQGQQQISYAQAQHRQQQQNQQQHHQQPQHFNHPSQQNQMIMQHRQPQMHHNQQHQMVQPQMTRHQMAQHHAQQPHPQIYVPRDMNLAVPLREPSPEPIPVKIEVPDVPPEGTSAANEEPMPDDGDIDIQIRNVVCNYTLPLHIDLRKLAMNTHNVTYEREKGVMMKQKRSPGCYIKVYSSGKVYIVGCRSEADCKRAARSIARHVQRVMGKTKERVSIRNYRVNNVLATCRLPFGIKIEEVAAKYPSESTYEPELSVGLVWRSVTPKATLRIHTTGSITVTGAQSEADVLEVLSKIYPIVLEFRCLERAKGNVAAQKKRKRKAPVNRGPPIKRERFDDSNYRNSGVINNQVYFSDEDEDLYDELDLEE
ncbi:TATA box-binding protein-like 1 [Caenorhabditis elegans]|uniref:TATA box-binding protein-like 1 n=1 Tax=Caenorhabditis elegans TaxID=6239 RepID=TBPL1_CAEEL|nr:TATA box-binding protein-like 1 [Caenorhabditis elegans]B2D6P4.1 RecName: Full=TATA box-binding protein-like 1; Short=TBP-like; AltName: Full=TBP-like factor; Short=CeTLF [Caenorhabditis elegans]CAQ35044.1 TATA box-binding protein-like 1 [Caenorhabditis elegans]|eukprot:NP_001122474.1 TBP-Like Factor [Caenorhabditis elegans]